MPYDETDPFSGGVRIPSLSWKDLPVGSIFICDVLEPAKLLQSRNYDTNQPDYWDSPANTQPKMSAVVNVRVVSGPHSVGEERSIWALKPSSLFVAIAQAQKAANAQLAPGGRLSLAFTGEVPHENKRFNAIKQYQAKYEPPQPQHADVFHNGQPGTSTATTSTPPPGTQTWRDQARQQAAPVGYPSTQPTQTSTPPASTPGSAFKW